MVRISQKAADLCKDNNRVIGRLVALFDKHYGTIERWISDRDVRLTLPAAMQILKEEIRDLSEDELLDQSMAEKA